MLSRQYLCPWGFIRGGIRVGVIRGGGLFEGGLFKVGANLKWGSLFEVGAYSRTYGMPIYNYSKFLSHNTMVQSCSAYGCTKRASKDSQGSFHRYLLNDKELCRKWVSAMRRVDFQPTPSSTLCSAHFLPKDYVDQTAKKQKLKETAVPSLFSFPKHLNKLKHKRKSPLKRKADINEELTTPPKKTRFDSLKEVSPRKKKLLRRIKTLKQKVRRKESKINSLKAALDHLEKEKLLDSDAANIIRQNFSGLKSELFQSELCNQNLSP